MSHVLVHRRRALVVAGAALVLGLAGTPACAQKPRDAATLRLDFYAYGLHAPFAYGVEKGIYAEQGIGLAILEGNGSGATVQQVGAGTDRFGFADATAMARLVSKGLPAKMIANYVQTSPLAIIFFRQGHQGAEGSRGANDRIHRRGCYLPALPGVRQGGRRSTRRRCRRSCSCPPPSRPP